MRLSENHAQKRRVIDADMIGRDDAWLCHLFGMIRFSDEMKPEWKRDTHPDSHAPLSKPGHERMLSVFCPEFCFLPELLHFLSQVPGRFFNVFMTCISTEHALKVDRVADHDMGAAEKAAGYMEIQRPYNCSGTKRQIRGAGTEWQKRSKVLPVLV